MFKLGWATRDITPDRPASLMGQMHQRIAKSALDPLSLTALALSDEKSTDGAVIVSYDLAFVSETLMREVRERVAKRAPELPVEKIIFSATHTHTSLVFEDEFYPPVPAGVMTPSEARGMLAEHGAEAVVEAWNSRAPGRLGRAFGHAVIGHNRRPVYAGGSAQMYGDASRSDFQNIEGQEDHSLDILFHWDERGTLTGVMIDIPCPSQVDEHLEQFSADYWHEVRVELRKRLGERLNVLPLCGIAGDISPHFILHKKQEEEMRQRRGVSERQVIAVQVANEVDQALACTKPMNDGALKHTVKQVSLSPRRVSKKERDESAALHKEAITRLDPASWWPARLQRMVDIHEGRIVPQPVKTELHFLRLGDTAMATNPFELFVDYGQRIKGRSPAAHTVLVQLCNGVGWYLPTQRGVDGGSYGAMAVVCQVGPEGGAELVEHTVSGIAELFPERKQG